MVRLAQYATSPRYRGRILAYVVLSVLAVAMMVPIAWTVSMSLKPKEDIMTTNPVWIPPHPTLTHYRDVILVTSIPRNTLNSAMVTGVSVVIVLVVGSLAAYGFSRSRMPRKDTLMYLILATMMIPGLSNLLPLYLVFARLGQLDSLRTLIVIYSSWMLPWTIWLMRGFFDSIPRELEEAAVVDGCGKLGALFRVVFPISAPGLGAAAISNAIFAWNEFMVAVVFINSAYKRTLPVGIFSFMALELTEWGTLTAASVVAVVPILVAFLLLQRYFVRGMVEGAVKG